MKAIDLGNYSAVPTQEQVRCIIAAGYMKAIVGTSFGSVWQQQIEAFERGGIDVEEYVFPGHQPRSSRPFWIDCETGDATTQAIRALAPTATGIYTRRGWWVSETGDWDIKTEFPHLRLWDASYGDPPPAFVPYGGFSGRAMHQWHDSTLLCGLNVDLNIMEARMYDDRTIDLKLITVIKELANTRDALKDAILALGQANAGSFKAIEDRLKALEAK